MARQWTVTFAVAILTLWLWTKSDFSMRRLRVLEIVLFGLVLTDITWAFCDELFVQHRLRPFVLSGAFQTLSSDVVWNYVSSWLLLFFVLIVGYGILIPSTWRRCTTMVATVALLPIALFVVGAYGREPRWSVPWEFSRFSWPSGWLSRPASRSTVLIELMHFVESPRSPETGAVSVEGTPRSRRYGRGLSR